MVCEEVTDIFGTDLGIVEFLLLLSRRVIPLLLLGSDLELAISGASWRLTFCCVTHGTAVVVAIGLVHNGWNCRMYVWGKGGLATKNRL